MTRILLVGRSHWVIDAVRDKLQTADLQVDGALDAPDATDVLRRAHVDHVFIGPGLDVDTRLEVVRTVITGSDTTTVHLKDQSTGPEGALRWVRAVLLALDEMQDVDGGHGR